MKTMKPLTLALVFLATAAAVFAFDPTVRGNRIGVVDVTGRYPSPDASVAQSIERRLCEELRDRGFDAFQVETPIDRLVPFDPANADYYVEIVGTGGASVPVADASLGAGRVAVDLGVLVSHVATRLRLYDGRSLDLLQTFNLEKHSTAVVPTGFGLWTGHVAFGIATPARWLQDRTLMHRVAVDAASNIAREINR